MRSLSVLIAVLLVIVTSGCASRTIIVVELDDAIKQIASKTIAAHCHGAALTGAEAELAVKSAYKVDIGAPTGAIPITLGGGTSFEESSRVKVTIQLPAKSACPTAAALVVPAVKPFLYDPETGTVREVK